MILYRDTYVDILFKVSVISSDVCGYSRYSETVQKRQLSVTRMYLLLICHTNLNIGTHTWYSMIFNDIQWYSMILYDVQYGYDILLIWYGYSIKAKKYLLDIRKYLPMIFCWDLFDILDILDIQNFSIWANSVFLTPFNYLNLFRLLNRQISTLFGHRGDI